MSVPRVKRIELLREEIEALTVCCTEWQARAHENERMVSATISMLVQLADQTSKALTKEGYPLPAETILSALDELRKVPENSGAVYCTIQARAVAAATASGLETFTGDMEGVSSFIVDNARRTKIERPVVPMTLNDELEDILMAPLLLMSTDMPNQSDNDPNDHQSSDDESESDEEEESEPNAETQMVVHTKRQNPAAKF